MKYEIIVDEYYEEESSIIIEMDNNDKKIKKFFIAVNSNNYDILGYIAAVDYIYDNLNDDEYISTSLEFEYTEHAAVKPNLKSDFMYYEYPSYKYYNEWYNKLDKEEFKKRMEKVLIEVMI